MAEGSSNAVAVSEQPRPARVPLVAGNSPRAIVPTDFEGAWRIATAVVAAQMAPKSLKTVEACAVAILHGLEVGLTPMNALQSIAVINGRPSLWGDGALGLIQASGLLEDQDEHYEDEDGPHMKALCILKRKGKARPYVGEFSMQDAQKAGLLAKEGPWQGYRKRMMKMRARAFAMRDGFSDVLKGLSVAEEQEDVERARTVTTIDDGGGPPKPANDDGGGPPVPDQAATVTEVVAETVTEDGGGPPAPAEDDLAIPDYLRRSADKPPVDDGGEGEWLESLENAFGACEDMSSLAEQQDRLMTPHQNSVTVTAWNAACDKLDRHVERVSANTDGIDDETFGD